MNNAKSASAGRKIIVLEFISLDGVMQAPGGPKEDTSGGFKYGGWTFPYFDDEAGAEMEKQMTLPFDLLLGRRTFDIFSNYWPEHESDWPGVNDVAKYVVSKKLNFSKWNNSKFINGKAEEEIAKLKKTKGPNLHVYGSGKMVQTLLKNDLVDELWVKIFPVTLGKGNKLFDEGTMAAAFKLTFSEVLDSGVIFANYIRDGKVKTGSF